MNLSNRATVFNAMIINDATDDYEPIRHKLTFSERKPITVDMLEAVRQDKAERQVSGKKWHPLAGTPAYAMYEDANYVGNFGR